MFRHKKCVNNLQISCSKPLKLISSRPCYNYLRFHRPIMRNQKSDMGSKASYFPVSMGFFFLKMDLKVPTRKKTWMKRKCINLASFIVRFIPMISRGYCYDVHIESTSHTTFWKRREKNPSTDRDVRWSEFQEYSSTSVLLLFWNQYLVSMLSYFAVGFILFPFLFICVYRNKPWKRAKKLNCYWIHTTKTHAQQYCDVNTSSFSLRTITDI